MKPYYESYVGFMLRRTIISILEIFSSDAFKWVIKILCIIFLARLLFNDISFEPPSFRHLYMNGIHTVLPGMYKWLAYEWAENIYYVKFLFLSLLLFLEVSYDIHEHETWKYIRRSITKKHSKGIMDLNLDITRFADYDEVLQKKLKYFIKI